MGSPRVRHTSCQETHMQRGPTTGIEVNDSKRCRRGRFPKIKEVQVVHTLKTQSLTRRLATVWTKALSIVRLLGSVCEAAPLPSLCVSDELPYKVG